jgi:hemolysin activation/secretion protein
MKRNWTTLLLLWTVCATAHAVDIPAVKDRDPNPLTSPRYVVTEISVANFVPLESRGITKETVDAFLAERLQAMTDAEAPGPSGFTASELEEIGRLLSSMGVHRERGALSPRETADLLELIREQKARRGVSLVQLERLAAELGDFYRSRGLPLAVAYVPVQQVTGGRVALAVEPGVLERVDVVGPSRYPETLIQAAFADQIGAPVEHRRIEEALYQVNALPGLDTEGRFTAGDQVGGSRLAMNVRGERRIGGHLRIDNHGNERSGEQRALGELDWYNPTGYGDALSIGAVGANDPDQTIFGYVQYERPLGSLRTVGHLRVASGAFDWEDSSTRLDGDNVVTELGIRHELHHNRRASFAVDGALGWQRLALDPEGATDIDEQRVLLGSFGASAHRVSDVRELVAEGRAGIDIGSYLDGEPADDTSFGRLTVDAHAWTPVDIPGFARSQRFGLRFAGQVANTQLPGTLQLGLGGAGHASAFDPSLVSVDDGAYVGLDLRLRPELLRWGEFRVFADVAYGEQKRRFDDDLWAYLSDAGVGWTLDLASGLTTEIRWSYPINAKGEDDDIDDDGARWLWLLTFQPGRAP